QVRRSRPDRGPGARVARARHPRRRPDAPVRGHPDGLHSDLHPAGDATPQRQAERRADRPGRLAAGPGFPGAPPGGLAVPPALPDRPVEPGLDEPTGDGLVESGLNVRRGRESLYSSWATRSRLHIVKPRLSNLFLNHEKQALNGPSSTTLKVQKGKLETQIPSILSHAFRPGRAAPDRPSGRASPPHLSIFLNFFRFRRSPHDHWPSAGVCDWKPRPARLPRVDLTHEPSAKVLPARSNRGPFPLFAQGEVFCSERADPDRAHNGVSYRTMNSARGFHQFCPIEEYSKHGKKH